MRTVLAAIVLAGVASPLAAQGGAPTFDVATVKPSAGDRPMQLQRTGNRIVTTNTPLCWLIKWAFDLDDDRLVGCPTAPTRL
jgi:hypothetical protein